jgi:predicted nucleic acid-binding protein
MIVVADTSPINYLVLIGHIEILPHFYGRILIPPSVWEELQDRNTPDSVRKWVAQGPAWLEMRNSISTCSRSGSFRRELS